jgi:hypothetical protein
MVGGAAEVERVLLAFDGFGGVEIAPEAIGNREIGLLDAGEHLGVERLLKGFGRFKDGVGVGVFGLEVVDDLGVFFFAEPGVIVDAKIAVEEMLDGYAGGDGGLWRGVSANGHGVFLKILGVHFPFC